ANTSELHIRRAADSIFPTVPRQEHPYSGSRFGHACAIGFLSQCRSTRREAQGHRHRRRPPRCRRKHARARASGKLAASSTPRSSTGPATDRDQSSNHQEVWCSTLEEGLDRSIQGTGRRLLLLLAGDGEKDRVDG
uniref:Uncharacterized protein n=1 Tax=Triticum urartu TaxID=4572 RepID=A0A8R7UKM3_TRIUA